MVVMYHIVQTLFLKQFPITLNISINEYLIDQEIKPHIDSPYIGDVIVVLNKIQQ